MRRRVIWTASELARIVGERLTRAGDLVIVDLERARIGLPGATTGGDGFLRRLARRRPAVGVRRREPGRGQDDCRDKQL
jgi:hypothetical protein